MNRRKFSIVLFLHVHAAVDLDYLAGDVGAHVGSEEGSHVGDILGLTAATERNFLCPLCADLVGKGGGHGCLDEAGGYGIGADSAGADFLGYALGEGDESGLGGGVVSLTGVAVNAHYGGHVDYRAAALAHHDGEDGVDEVEGAFEVYCDYGVPLSLGHAHHEAVFGDAGVVDKDVDAAEVFDNLCHYVLGLVEVGGVGGVAFALHAAGGDFSLGGFAVFVYCKVGESDVGALLGETQGKGLADAAGRSGDEGGFSFE